MNIVTFSELRNNLKEIMDSSADQHEPTIVKRSKGTHMVLIALTDYESLKETAYLLSIEANAKHLRRSIRSLRAGEVVKKNLIEE